MMRLLTCGHGSCDLNRNRNVAVAPRKDDILHVIYLLFLVLKSDHYCVEGFARKKQRPFLYRLLGSQAMATHEFLGHNLENSDPRPELLMIRRGRELIEQHRRIVDR
jgi:hypothetical protein